MMKRSGSIDEKYVSTSDVALIMGDIGTELQVSNKTGFVFEGEGCPQQSL